MYSLQGIVKHGTSRLEDVTRLPGCPAGDLLDQRYRIPAPDGIDRFLAPERQHVVIQRHPVGDVPALTYGAV